MAEEGRRKGGCRRRQKSIIGIMASKEWYVQGIAQCVRDGRGGGGGLFARKGSARCEWEREREREKGKGKTGIKNSRWVDRIARLKDG